MPTERVGPLAVLALGATLALPLSPSLLLAQDPGASSAPSTERLIGTVTAVDARAGSFDLTIGVGHSLRARRIRLSAATSGRSHAAAALPMPARGAVVRVTCASGPGGTIASAIDSIAPPAAAGRP